MNHTPTDKATFMCVSDIFLRVLPLGSLMHTRTADSITHLQERNREHAKRSRIRKKFMLECLQEQLLAMRKQNLALRQVLEVSYTSHTRYSSVISGLGHTRLRSCAK